MVDPATAVARELDRRLPANDLLSGKTSTGQEKFWTGGQPAQVMPVIEKLWGHPVELDALPARFAMR